MDCFRCKRSVVKPLKCKTCKHSYHPSCAKLIVSSKQANCCVTSLASSQSPGITVATSQNQFFFRPSSLSNLKRKESTLSSFKSLNSSPRTPPVTVGDDSVFLSPITVSSPTMSKNSNEAGEMSNEYKSSDANTGETRPNWASYSLDDKLNLLLDMSFKNSSSIQNVANNLDNHNREIKSLVAKMKLNNNKIKTWSSNLDNVNKSLAEISKVQSSTQKDINEINNKLRANSEKCNENSTQIGILKSTIDSLADVSTNYQIADQHMSSELLLSGVPDNIAAAKTREQIVRKVFDQLGISDLTLDILSIRNFNVKGKQSASNRKQISHSYVLHLKSSDVCHHIIDIKRRSQKLKVNNIFDSSSEIDSGR